MIIDDEKKNLWTFSRFKAFELAESEGKDLVQISYDPEKMISTVRLTDYWKYMYEKGKEEKDKRKNQKAKVLKELKINYAIGENDLQLKIKKGKEFLGEGHNVKFSIKLRGRENIYANKAIERLMQIKTALEHEGKTQFDTPKKEAQWYSIILFSKTS